MNTSYQNASAAAAETRVAIVTGATSGMGEQVARLLCASGFHVLGTGRNAVKLEEMQYEIGATFRGLAGDINEESIQDRLFEEAERVFGAPVSLVLVNAGRGLGGTVMSSDIAQFEAILKLNLVSSLSMMQKSGRKMLAGLEARPYPKHAADIVVLGSIVGRHLSPFSAAYGATKFALHSLVEGLRRELGPKGIRVTLIEPGFVVSGFQQAAGYTEAQVQGFHEKFGPLLESIDVAETIRFIVTRPPHLHVSDAVIRPTRQDYP